MFFEKKTTFWPTQIECFRVSKKQQRVFQIENFVYVVLKTEVY